MANSLVARGLSKVREIVANATSLVGESPERMLERIRHQLQECADGRGGEVSTRQRAARLAQTYLGLDDEGRRAFLRIISLEFGPDPVRIAEAHAEYQAALGSPSQWEAEGRLRETTASARIRILTQFNAIAQGVKFLVDMRADLLRHLRNDPELAVLDHELETALTTWFDVGFLELTRLTWHSPAALLEKIVEYEAVHEISSWRDLKNRLDADRRCYAFFHPRMPMEPLIFVEVALLEELADNVQNLLDEHAPVFDSSRATTAIFYSISNTQPGLRGVSFGNFLLKRVVDDLKRDFPKLKTFATLSPIPGLVRWAVANHEEVLAAFSTSDWKRLAEAGVEGPESTLLESVLAGQHLPELDSPLSRALRQPLTKIAARYLLGAKKGIRPLDPVARFHLGNGARVERLNWMADLSSKGVAQSWGMMVNYLYDPDRIEENLEAHAEDGRIDSASSLRKLLDS
jgi:malonyl-CoA decarboxylase